MRACSQSRIERYHLYMTGIIVIVLVLAVFAGAGAVTMITDGLTVYCPFDGAAAARSMAGFAKPGSSGPYAFTDGKFGQGLLVDCTGGRYGISYPCAYNMNCTDGTIAFWIKPVDMHPVPASVDKRIYFLCASNDGATSGMMIYRTNEPEGSLVVACGVIGNDGTWNWQYGPSVTTDWSPDSWYHIALVWKDNPKGGGCRELYINGGLAGRYEFSQGKHSGVSDELYFHLGGTLPGSPKTYYGNGVYDDLCIWRRALSSAEIRALYSGNYEPDLANTTIPSLIPHPPVVSFPGKNISLDLASLPNRIFRRAKALVANDLGIIDDSQSISFSLSWQLDPAHLPKCIEIRTHDIWGKPAGRPYIINNPADTGLVKRPISIRPGRRGIFRVSACVKTQDGQMDERDLFTFAVIPSSISNRRDNTERFIGTHAWWENPEWHGKTAARMGFGWTRCHDACQATMWRYVEPVQGKFIWNDKTIGIFHDVNNLSVLGLLEATPQWASSNQNTGSFWTYPPANWDEFETYVKNTVLHFRNQIHTWEVWNEPHGSGFWNGTPGQYAEMLKRSYRIIKSIDPSMAVVGFGGIDVRNLDWAEQVMKTGALNYCDTVSFHYYEADESQSRSDAGSKCLEKWKKLMAKYGSVKPIWDTEESAGIGSFNREYRSAEDNDSEVLYSAACTARKLVLNRSCGLQKIFLYDMLRRAQSPSQYRKSASRVIEDYGSPHPAGVAASNVANLLYGTAPAGRLDPHPNVIICLFKRIKSTGDPLHPEKSGSLAVIMGRKWTQFDPPARWVVSDSNVTRLKVVDMMGGIQPQAKKQPLALKLSAEPQFLIAPDLSADALGRLLSRGKVGCRAFEPRLPLHLYVRGQNPKSRFADAAFNRRSISSRSSSSRFIGSMSTLNNPSDPRIGKGRIFLGFSSIHE